MGSTLKSGAEIHREFERKYGKEKISKRKVQQLITGVFMQSFAGGRKEDFPLEFWHPWVDKRSGSAAQAFLLRLNAVSRVNYERNLYEVEAEWGVRLRASLGGLNIHDQLQLVRMYAGREINAYYSDESILTDDLDGICAYRPCLSENQSAFNCAIQGGFATLPLLDGPDWQGRWVRTFQRGIQRGSEDLPGNRATRMMFFPREGNELEVDKVRDFWSNHPELLSRRRRARSKLLRRIHERQHSQKE